MQTNYDAAAARLNKGGVGVLPTDTLYGLVGQALNPTSVHRIYELKHRGERKPSIILVASISQLADFGVDLSASLYAQLERLWPASVTVALTATPLPHLPLGEGGTLAFRIPKSAELLELLSVTGPLIAPSANPEGEASAMTIAMARQYFGAAVDFYVDGGELSGLPSTLVLVEQEGGFKIMREGADIDKVKDIFGS